MCEAGVSETLYHALLQYARVAAERQPMWAGPERVVGVQRVAQARALPEDQRLDPAPEAHLGNAYWGLTVLQLLVRLMQPGPGGADACD